MNSNTLTAKMKPFQVLGLTPESSEQEIRLRYLELVKTYTPEHHPDKFREIQTAYEAARDPLVLAEILLHSSAPDEPPSWQSAIDQQALHPPQMTPNFLLSLGNRASNYRPPLDTLPQKNETSS